MLESPVHPSPVSDPHGEKSGADHVKRECDVAPNYQVGRFDGVNGGVSDCPADLFVSHDCRLLIVADGLGRTNDQHHVSKNVVTSLRSVSRRLKPQQTVEQLKTLINVALLQTNAEMVEQARKHGLHSGVGASVVLAVRIGQQLIIKAVGDCRAYLLRNGKFTALTFDDTLSELLVSTSGAHHRSLTARLPNRVLLRHLGQHDYLPNDEFHVLKLLPEDRVLLCTRGITESVPDSDLAKVVTTATTPKSAAKAATVAALSNHARYATASATLFVS